MATTSPQTPAENRVLPFPAVLNALTSLRYLAALWVVLFHFKQYFPATGLDDLFILQRGYLGVDFFFILSGFVLAHVYLDKLAHHRFDYWGFMVRRFARIYPLHLMTLVLTIALSVISIRSGWAFTQWDLAAWTAMGSGELIRTLFANMTLIHAWGATDGLAFNLPSWSISAEWFAYLLFPAFALALCAKRLPAWLAVVLCVVGTVAFDILHQQVVGRSLYNTTWNIGALRIIPTFALGIALRRWGDHMTLGPRLALPAFLAAFAVLIVLLAIVAPPITVVLALAAIVHLAADAERHGNLPLVGHPFPVLLGEVSYSVYLLHFPIGVVFFDVVLGPMTTDSALTGLALILVAATGITLLAWVSHRFFELPSRQLLIKAGRGASPHLANSKDKTP